MRSSISASAFPSRASLARGLLLLATAVALSGCGIKGDLYKARPTAPAPADAAADHSKPR